MIKPNHSKIRAALRRLIDARLRFGLLAAIIAISSGAAFSSHAAECSASSSKHRVALLELYTSEGCSSCPPAERWLNGLRARGVGDDRLVPLAFHVDYWDYIGWKDRFAQSGFAARQRLVADRNHAAFIYTPQFVLDGRDFQRPWLGNKLTTRLEKINAETARLEIDVRLNTQDNNAFVSVHVRNKDTRTAHFYAALYENGLSTEVQGGENAGKRLYHEDVVRSLNGPLVVAPGADLMQRYDFDLSAYGDYSRLGLAFFAEDGTSGATMQAMALPVCPKS